MNKWLKDIFTSNEVKYLKETIRGLEESYIVLKDKYLSENKYLTNDNRKLNCIINNIKKAFNNNNYESMDHGSIYNTICNISDTLPKFEPGKEYFFTRRDGIIEIMYFNRVSSTGLWIFQNEKGEDYRYDSLIQIYIQFQRVDIP